MHSWIWDKVNRSIKNEGKQKLKDFITRKPPLQEMLKEIL